MRLIAVLALSTVVPCLLLAAGPFGVAEARELPRVSPSEQIVNETNEALKAARERQELQDRFQFEINTLRAQQQRQQQFPAITGPNINMGCPPGAAGCDSSGLR